MINLDDLLARIGDRKQENRDWPLYEKQGFGHFSDRLQTRQPNKTFAVIGIPDRSAISDFAPPRLVALSRFRAPFSAIWELSWILAPTVVSTGIVPTILPIESSALKGMTWDGSLIREFRTHGFLLYRKNGTKHD